MRDLVDDFKMAAGDRGFLNRGLDRMTATGESGVLKTDGIHRPALHRRATSLVVTRKTNLRHRWSWENEPSKKQRFDMECVYEATPMDFGRIGVVFIETNKQGVRFETDACYEAEKIVRALIKEEQVEGYDDRLLHGETVAFPADEIWKVWDRWECKKCRRLRLGDPMIRAGSRFCQFCSQELSRNLTEST